MALKDLMVLLDATEASARRADLAAALALRHGAYVRGVCLAEAIRPMEPLVLSADAYAFGSGITAFITEMKALRERQIAPIEAALDQRLARDGLTGGFVLEEGAPIPAALGHARRADLVIAGQTDPEGGKDQPVVNPIEEILLGAGRPLLVVPRYGNFPSCGETVLVGWTDTREATRAVHDAMPILAAAKAVTVLTVGGEHGGGRAGEDGEEVVPAAPVAEHLARHGVPATAAQTVSGGLSPADVLLNYASDIGADLIVVGGYGHSRLREVTLGGVTQSLLQHMTVPVLFSH
ncbi:MAG TPA: universal stress protein [Acetobacteraceae bacterium]|nr:universal stress protein [Acetobacteraceae bacterium]